MIALNQRKQFVLPFMRVILLVLLCWFISQAVIAGQYTLGAMMWSLFPAFTVGVIFVMVEILFRERTNFSFHFKLGKVDPKIWMTCFVFGLVAGIFILYAVPSSPIHVILILIIAIAMTASGVLMMQGSGVNAVCVFILVLPFMVFERSQGYIGYKWTEAANNLDIGILTDDVIYYFYVIILVCAWALRTTINREKIKSKSWAFGPLLLLIGGLFSLIFISTSETKAWFISSHLLPVLLFIVFINDINTWKDVKKLSLALGIMGGVITFLFLYYALYRTPVTTGSLVELVGLRGGGGLSFGSRAEGYNGVYFEYLSPMVIPVALALACSESRKLTRYIWGGLTLLMIFTTIYTFGRNGFIMLFACLLPWLLLLFKKRPLLSVLISTALFFLVYFIPEIIGALFTRFESFTSLHSLLDETRVKVWIGSFRMFFNHPLFGIGIEMFSKVSGDYGLYITYKDLLGASQSDVVVNAHGTFFQIIAEMGLVGIVAWCAILWIPLKRLIKPLSIPIYWSSEEQFWITAMKSNILVVMIFLFIGSFTIFGIDAIRNFIFILWLAVIHIMDNLYRKEPI